MKSILLSSNSAENKDRSMAQETFWQETYQKISLEDKYFALIKQIGLPSLQQNVENWPASPSTVSSHQNMQRTNEVCVKNCCIICESWLLSNRIKSAHHPAKILASLYELNCLEGVIMRFTSSSLISDIIS
jgi:hypothetical protein